MPLRHALLLPALLGAALPAAAWGDAGHRLVAGLSLKALPAELKPWFQGREQACRDHSSDPDCWKAHDRKEGPRHYLDAEAYGGPDAVPVRVEDALARLGPRAFQKAGQLPWIVQDRLRDLSDAFRAGDAERVVWLAAVLGHYVGDLHVPLHCTSNYDGRDTGQRGVHGRWESGLLGRAVSEECLTARPVERERDLFHAPWRWMKESHALVPGILAADRDADRTSPESLRGRRRGEAYWMILRSRQEAVLRLQLERAGSRAGQLIRYAWELAGRPKAPVG